MNDPSPLDIACEIAGMDAAHVETMRDDLVPAFNHRRQQRRIARGEPESPAAE